MGKLRGTISFRRWATRRVWLPSYLYAAIPWVYCALGAAALVSGLFLPDPDWIIPYLLLLSTAGLHAGLWVLVLRRRHRCRLLRSARTREPEPESPVPLS